MSDQTNFQDFMQGSIPPFILKKKKKSCNISTLFAERQAQKISNTD